jgi:C4-dicarboxylate transporter DctQ subunit
MNINKLINRIEEDIMSLLLVTMTLLVFVEVVLRFGFNTGILWAQEATLHLSAWFVLFGASYGIKAGTHIGVDAVVNLFPSKIKRLITVLALLMCLAYCSLFLYGSWIYLDKMYMIGIEMEDLPIPRWASQSILLFGFGLLTFRFLTLLWHVITGETDGFRHHSEVEDSMKMAVKEEEKTA